MNAATTEHLSMERGRAHIVFALFLFVLHAPGWAQVHGTISGPDGRSIPGAHIHCLTDEGFTATDLDGRFTYRPDSMGMHRLAVHALGFHDSTFQVNWTGGEMHVDWTLRTKVGQLNMVVVSAEAHDKQEGVLSAEHIDQPELRDRMAENLSSTLERLPGVSALKTGVGIGKPVIRGLHGQRIVVLQQNIRQEGQQWGSDHGLEVDAFGAPRVEIVKGPASLQHGSDGLGGVVRIAAPPIPERGTLDGEVVTLFRSNTMHWGGTAALGVHTGPFFARVRYTRHDFGDTRVPAADFDYNGFTLPIEGNRLKNTAGEEESIRGIVGLRTDRGIHRLTVDRYRLRVGLFSGAVGIPRAYALAPDGDARNISFPGQQVTHWRGVLNHLIFLDGDDHIGLDIGIQHNHRQEFSVPEFHSVPPDSYDPNDRLALELKLLTISASAHYERHLPRRTDLVTGASAQWQRNERGGFEVLVPDFTTWRSGVFALARHERPGGTEVSGGLRLDVGTNTTSGFIRPVWSSNGEATDSLVSPPTDQVFVNAAASAGIEHPVDGRPLTLRAHAGKSFRIPSPAETSSNGVHHGTFRHEVGQPDLRSEHGYQLDLGLDVRRDRYTAAFSTYLNYFQNFIYLGPSNPARFSPLPEAGQLFTYRQDDAVHAGFEYSGRLRFLNVLDWEHTADLVQSRNLRTGLAIPFTPQPMLRNTLGVEWTGDRAVRRVRFGVEHVWRAPAQGPWRTDRTELETPGSQVVHLRAGLDVAIRDQPIQIRLQVRNVFNTPYLDHLSRYRWIDVVEPGRNVTVMVRVPIHVNLHKNPS